MLLRLLTAGLLSTALAGCCGTKNCDTCLAEGLSLRFDADSLNGGFRWSEVRSAYVVRYTLNNYQQPLDTVWLQQNSPYLYSTSFGVSLNEVFLPRPGNSLRFNQYSYRVLVPAAQRQYDVTNIELAFEEGKGCCACSQLTRRRFQLNSVPVTADPPDTQGLVLRR
ncbi:hypothetical protein [Hymenobacter sp. BT190]|uniref:hypothetical protein n=1 Tax=Hymenobacter sp. BT190 TaxID=2763505 RepID=UPI001650E155|nr:hypothetical protein [Hymenobacter sp. BT190]MBC6697587.1 hypothetical protein [Hymenobacter sp. BT190]